MRTRIGTVFLIASVFVLFTGCDKLNDSSLEPAEDDYSEEPMHDPMTEKVDVTPLERILEAGYNLRLSRVTFFTEDIIDDTGSVEFMEDVVVNIADVLYISGGDMLTIGNQKKIPSAYLHSSSSLAQAGVAMDYFTGSPVFLNCERLPIYLCINSSTVWVIDEVKREYKGTLYLVSEPWQIPYYGNPNDQAFNGKLANTTYLSAEFEMHDGHLILKLPAQYTTDSIGYESLPLSAKEVEEIITNGTEGVDYSFFAGDGFIYVRIGNNLYQRRYDSWIYVGLADIPTTTAWLRKQTWITFDIVDWKELTQPLPRWYIESKFTAGSDSDTHWAARYFDDEFRIADEKDIYDISTNCRHLQTKIVTHF